MVLALASRFSKSTPPDYVYFYSACDDLNGHTSVASFDTTLESLQTTFEERVKCSQLALSANRGLGMFKLVLGYRTREPTRLV